MRKKFYCRRSPRWTRWLGVASYRVTRLYVTPMCGIKPPYPVLEPDGYGRLDSDGRLYILPGYEFAPTGPVPDTDEMVMASCAHDFLYRLGSLGLLPPGWRARADRFMRLQMKNGADNILETGYAYVAWAGVRTLYWPLKGLQKVWNFF